MAYILEVSKFTGPFAGFKLERSVRWNYCTVLLAVTKDRYLFQTWFERFI